jgi:Thiamine pyrophosphate-requiring enzymes [acetolactate synthase, pyruvate dehydrogenase (cytochrome), glyoxylate carboligase, phosphonopyruvate decarboxylase]
VLNTKEFYGTTKIMKLPNFPENNSQPRQLSDLVIDYLELLGVEYVFGVPGGHIAPLYEALERSECRGGPRAILSRQESGAAFMADGYARETGKIGVCCSTTGPGATNLITGIASSYSDHVPILAITGQTILPKFGVGAFQESSPDVLDTTSMLNKCTRYNSVVTHPKQLENKLIAALKSAFQSPPGPVHLSVPVDVFRSPAPETISYPHIRQLLTKPAFADLAAIEKLGQMLEKLSSQNRKVVLLVGEDCGEASSEILAFAELMGAEITTTQGGNLV